MLPVLVVGVVGGIVAVGAHESDDAFVFAQQHSRTIEPLQLERLVQRAREPVPGNNGTAAVSAHCAPGRTDERRNPWSCDVKYKSGRRVVYRVLVATNGSFRGIDRTAERLVRGCCVTVP
jgi:hypothetical protein